MVAAAAQAAPPASRAKGTIAASGLQVSPAACCLDVSDGHLQAARKHTCLSV